MEKAIVELCKIDFQSRKTSKLIKSEINCLECVYKHLLSYHVSEFSELIKLTNCVINLSINCASDNKALQKLDKLLTLLWECNCAGVVNAVADQLNSADVEILKWSPILDVSTVWRKATFPSLEKLLDKLKDVLSLEMQKNAGSQKELHTCVKMCLQIFQFYEKEIKQVLASKQMTALLGEKVLSQMCDLSELLVDILNEQRCSEDICMLSGTVIGQLVMMYPFESACQLYLTLKETIEHKIETLNFKSSENDTLCFAELCLIQGILCLATTEFLWRKIETLNKEKLLPFKSIIIGAFVSVIMFCSSRYAYHGFQTLLLWYKKCENITEHLHMDKQNAAFAEICLFNHKSAIILETMQIIRTQSDSRIPGVPELASSVFAVFLDVHNKEKLLMGDMDNVLDVVLNEIFDMPWHVKGKHRLLSRLVKYTEWRKIYSSDPNLPLELLNCQKSNFLAASSADLYKELTRGLKQFGSMKQWSDIWLDLIVKALTSDSRICRHNISTLVVPTTLRIFPESYRLLMNSLNARQNRLSNTASNGMVIESDKAYNLHALIIVMKYARQLELLTVLEDEGCLRDALFHSDDQIRADAFSLLSQTQKKSEPLNPLEMQYINDFFHNNLNIDSPQFRGVIVTGMKSVLVRIRNSCLTCLKELNSTQGEKPGYQEKLEKNIRFLDGLLKICMKNLYPGASFQRKTTTLDILFAMYDTFLQSKCQLSKKKGIPPEAVISLMRYAHTRGYLLFHDQICLKSLLVCTQDDSNSVQQTACDILENFFSWPLHWKSIPDMEFASILFQQCLRLASSPRQQDGTCGAQLYSILLQKYIWQCQWHLMKLENGLLLVVAEGSESPLMGSLKFLLSEIKVSIVKAEHDVLQAATESPGHGLIQCLLRTLMIIPSDVFKSMELGSFVEDVILFCEKVISNCLSVLGGCHEGKASAPSFAEIGTSIFDAVRNFGENEDFESPVLSEDYKIILSWCWVNLKECSILLSEMAHTFCLSFVLMQNITNLFVRILTKCRHRGVLEGCNIGFSKFCAFLLKSLCQEIQDLPRNIIQQVFSLLQTSGNASSITRRSAGLPYILTTILTCEIQTKRTALLNETINKLFLIAHQELPSNENHCFDLPQVHALNILKTILRESHLSLFIQPYISDVMIMSIKGFASMSWAVRNASMQLFGTVLLRVFGQKKIKDESSIINSSITIEQFFVQYPDLKGFMENSLQSCLNGEVLHPTVFPVLATISRLSPTSSKVEGMPETFTKFVEPITKILASPQYAIRKLAAASIPALICPDKRKTYILHIINNKLPVITENCKQNSLHGQLLLLDRILSLESCAVSTPDKNDIGISLDSKSWIKTAENPCALTRALYLKICHDYYNSYQSQGEIMNYSENMNIKEHRKIGMFYLQQVISNIILLRTTEGDVVKHLDMLFSADEDSKCYILDCIENMLKSHYEISFTAVVEEKLLNLFIKEENMQVLQKCIDVLLQLNNFKDSSLSNCEVSVYVLKKLDSIITSNPNTILVSASLCLTAVIIHKFGNYCVSMVGWSKQIFHLSRPEQNESIRLYCAKALMIIGAKLFQQTNIQLKTHITVFESSVLLLTDENPEIRQTVGMFVAEMVMPSDCKKYESLQFNICLNRICGFMMNRYKDDFDWLQYICVRLYRGGSLLCLLQDSLSKQRSMTMYEQDEINMFAETVRFVECLHESMMAIPSGYYLDGRHERVHRYIIEQSNGIVKEMEISLKVLTEIIEDSPLFNALLQTKIHSVLVSLSLLSDFLGNQIKSCGSSHTLCDRLNCLRVKIIEILANGCQ